jgi:2-(1,2-epoxy-1,2-dihydrophenyl)acetyl-CoA isomerase
MDIDKEIIDDSIVVLTLNRPEVMNALSLNVVHELDEHVARAEQDGCRAIIVTGAGDRAFSAGNDIHEFTRLTKAELTVMELERRAATWRWLNSPLPTIAALNGLAYGGGAILAACADFRVGGPRARFKVAAASFGNSNISYILPALIGVSHARDILMTSRVVQPEECVRMGLYNRYAEDGDVIGVALELARQIAANPPAGPRFVKTLINGTMGDSLEASYEKEYAVYMANVIGGDASELFSGFLAKRETKSSATSATG